MKGTALLACVAALVATQAVAQTAPSAYADAVSFHTTCTDEYLSYALRTEWEGTASDLADAAIDDCSGIAKSLVTVLVTSGLKLSEKDAQAIVDAHLVDLRRALIRHAVEYRNTRPIPTN